MPKNWNENPGVWGSFGGDEDENGLHQVRCPRCNRLALEANAEAWGRIHCGKCGWSYYFCGPNTERSKDDIAASVRDYAGLTVAQWHYLLEDREEHSWTWSPQELDDYRKRLRDIAADGRGPRKLPPPELDPS